MPPKRTTAHDPAMLIARPRAREDCDVRSKTVVNPPGSERITAMAKSSADPCNSNGRCPSSHQAANITPKTN